MEIFNDPSRWLGSGLASLLASRHDDMAEDNAGRDTPDEILIDGFGRGRILQFRRGRLVQKFLN